MQLGVFPHSPAAADVPVREQYQRAIAVTVATDLAEALSTRSSSPAVRYSRWRLDELEVRRGGMAE
jgi:hypothetical protein